MDAMLTDLRAEFTARLACDATAMQQLAQALPGSAAELIPLVHRLAGTGGMLGFSRISRLAGMIDEELLRLTQDVCRLDAVSMRSRIDTLADLCREEAPG